MITFFASTVAEMSRSPCDTNTAKGYLIPRLGSGRKKTIMANLSYLKRDQTSTLINQAAMKTRILKLIFFVSEDQDETD